MLINGKWMTETEVQSLISQLIADKKRLERQLDQMKQSAENKNNDYLNELSEKISSIKHKSNEIKR